MICLKWVAMTKSKQKELIRDYIRRTKSYRGSLISTDLNRLFKSINFQDCKMQGDKKKDDRRH